MTGMPRKVFLAGFAAVSLLAACSTGLGDAHVPANAKAMSQTEIQALLSRPVRFDNDVTGGMSYNFNPDGHVGYSMRMLPAQRTGTWRVEGSLLCIRVDTDPWDCGGLYQLSAKRYYFFLPQYGQDYNTLNLK